VTKLIGRALICLSAVMAACGSPPGAGVEQMLRRVQSGQAIERYFASTPPSDLRGISGFARMSQTPRPDYERVRLSELVTMKRDALTTVEGNLRVHVPAWLTESEAIWLRAAIRDDEVALEHADTPGTVYIYTLRRRQRPDEKWAFVTDEQGLIARADDLTHHPYDAATVRALELVTRILESTKK
jgi:hypothetical protein